MAETLTVNTDPDSATNAETLSPDEQDSLEIGEKMIAEQEQLLAGKYRNAEDLEKAYIELQKKLGDDSKEEAQPEATDETNDPVEISPNIQLIADASTEFNDKGEITPETLAKFEEMSSKDLVSAYMEMQSLASKGNATESTQSPDLSDADINAIKNSTGGEQEYSKIINWAEQNLPRSTVDAFDKLCDNGDVQAIQLAVNGLKAQYENANGYEGRMFSGKAPQTSGDVFRSQAEVVQAMSDQRYDRDPAYRQDILEKLDRSNVQF